MPQANELLVKSRAMTVVVPLSLKTMRSYYLPKYRHAEKFPSFAAAESSLLLDSSGFLRKALKKLPRHDWLYEHYSERGVAERDAVLAMYSEKLSRMFAPSSWGMPTRKLTVHLYESAASALSELQFTYSVPFSFLYTLALARALSTLPFVLPADSNMLQQIQDLLVRRVEQVATWVSRIDSLVGMPAYLRVANFLERDKLYTPNSIAVIAMSVAVIHAGMSASQRMRKVADIINQLLQHGFLKEVENRNGEYLCVKEFADEYGGSDDEDQ